MYYKTLILFLLCLVLIAAAYALIHYGSGIPWQSIQPPSELVKANGQRLSLMIMAGVALFFSIVFFAKGVRALKIHKRHSANGKDSYS